MQLSMQALYWNTRVSTTRSDIEILHVDFQLHWKIVRNQTKFARCLKLFSCAAAGIPTRLCQADIWHFSLQSLHLHVTLLLVSFLFWQQMNFNYCSKWIWNETRRDGNFVALVAFCPSNVNQILWVVLRKWICLRLQEHEIKELCSYFKLVNGFSFDFGLIIFKKRHLTFCLL